MTLSRRFKGAAQRRNEFRATGKNPADLSPFQQYGAIAHWDPGQEDLVTIDTGLSSYIDCISGFDFVQGTGPQQPTWSNADSAFGDAYSIAFSSASSQYMSGNFAAIQSLFEGGSNAFSIGIVALATNNANTKVALGIADTAGANNYWYVGHSPSETIRLSVFDGGYDEVASTTASLTTAHYAVFTFDGANTATARLNGSQEAQDTGFFESPVGLDICSFGARVLNTVGVYFDGKVRDLVIFDSELTGGNLSAVEAELATRAGI